MKRIVLTLIGIALGLYAAWWGAALARHLYVGSATSFDDLTQVMLVAFLACAAVLCPLLGWAGWKIGRQRAR